MLIRSMHEEGLAHDVVKGVVEDDSDDEEEQGWPIGQNESMGRRKRSVQSAGTTSVRQLQH